MKRIFLYAVALCLFTTSSNLLQAQYTAVTLGGNSANNELQIVVDATGSYMINRWIGGTWAHQFFSASNSDLFVLKIGATKYRARTAGNWQSRVDVSSNTVGANQEMTKLFTGLYNGQTFTVTIQISYNTSSPEFLIKTATIDATNIPLSTAITLGYGFDTYLGTSDAGYAYILPDIFGLNSNVALENRYLTTSQVQSLRLVGASNSTAGGAVIGFFPMGRPFDKANVCQHSSGVGNVVVDNTPGDGSATGTVRQNWFRFGTGSPYDNNHGVAYDNIPAGEITEIRTGHTFIPTIDGELDYFWNGVKNHTANIGDNVTLDLNYLSYSAIALNNVGFRVDHTGLQIRSGGCSSSGFTGGATSCTVGSEFFQIAGATVAAASTATVSIPVNIVRAGQWAVDGGSISEMTETLPFGESALLTVATTVALANNTPAYVGKGEAKQFVVQFPSTVTAANNVTVNLSYTGAITSFSTRPATVVIPAGQSSATFTVVGSPSGIDNSAMTITLSSTNLAFASIASPSTVQITLSSVPDDLYICAGKGVTFTATPTNGGSAPTYQWMVNGSPYPSATASTFYYVPSNGDLIFCEMTSNASCANPTVAHSQETHIIEYPLPVVSLAASPSSVCSGGTSTLTATVTGGTTPAMTYTWYRSGTQIGTTTVNTYNLTSLTVTAAYSVSVLNANGCTGSNTVTVTVNPLPVVSLSALPTTVCTGGASTLTATVTGGTTTIMNYTWTNSSGTLGITALPTYGLSSLTMTNNYTVTVTNGNGCTATSSPVTVTVIPQPTLSTVYSDVSVVAGTVVGPFSAAGVLTGASWTNSNTAIGLSASGTMPITAFTTINTTSAPISSVVTVTPYYVQNGVTCTGAPSTFTITVMPTGGIVVLPTSPAAVCLGATVNLTPSTPTLNLGACTFIGGTCTIDG
ncbi:MAG: hypothetical protein FWH23_08215, partial [Bacteroidales bacterium]|nr:hypothetical protein [Bacteroidales bacterium]